MPFPLAHPAAVLPLRRFCPRFLDLPALVAGSLSPDVGYAFGGLATSHLSHQFLGAFLFCLPVGWLLLRTFYLCRTRLLRSVPCGWRPTFSPLGSLSPGGSVSEAVSLLVGAWTHWALDSFANEQGWAARRSSVLQTVVGSLGGTGFKVCHLLWFALSFCGVAWLFLTYEQWLVRVSSRNLAWRPSRTDVVESFLWAGLLLPVGGAHYFTRGWYDYAGIGLLSAVWGVGVVMRFGGALRRNPAGASTNQTTLDNHGASQDAP